MPSLATTRNQVNDDGSTVYEDVERMLEASRPTTLGVHEFGDTFVRKFDASGRYGKYFLNGNNHKFTANIVAEVGSEEEGSWFAAYPKKMPASKLVCPPLLLRSTLC
jgi:hypothetical protein